MKKIISTFLCLSIFPICNAQVVELGLNAGNISSISVSLSTWHWLKIGAEIQDYDYSLNQYAFTAGNAFLLGFTPTLFLQPTIRISDKINVYGQYHLGYYINDYSSDYTKATDYELSFGGNYFIRRKISANLECGYIKYHIKEEVFFTYPTTGNYRYISVGLHFFFHTKSSKKSPSKSSE